MRKITAKEAEKLFSFTKKHYVEYFDIRMELVDHLASAMEKEWEISPEMTFEENLDCQFKKFGIFGFSEIVEEKTTAMEKYYWRIIFREILAALKSLPGAITFLLIFMGFSLLINSATGFIILQACVLFLFLVQGFFTFRLERRLKAKRKSFEKIYMLEEIILKTGGASVLFICAFNVMLIFDYADLKAEPILQYSMAVVVTLIIFLGYTSSIVIPAKKEKMIKG